MANSITHFNGENFFLSNAAPSKVILDGEAYPTVEHAFQAARTTNEVEREAIRYAVTPDDARRLGRKCTERMGWEQYQMSVMWNLLEQKFSHPELRAKLLATGDTELIEGNIWDDRFWGSVRIKGQWVGDNHLGRLLMRLRAQLREEPAS